MGNGSPDRHFLKLWFSRFLLKCYKVFNKGVSPHFKGFEGRGPKTFWAYAPDPCLLLDCWIHLCPALWTTHQCQIYWNLPLNDFLGRSWNFHPSSTPKLSHLFSFLFAYLFSRCFPTTFNITDRQPGFAGRFPVLTRFPGFFIYFPPVLNKSSRKQKASYGSFINFPTSVDYFLRTLLL